MTIKNALIIALAVMGTSFAIFAQDGHGIGFVIKANLRLGNIVDDEEVATFSSQLCRGPVGDVMGLSGKANNDLSLLAIHHKLSQDVNGLFELDRWNA
jgi:hypothetical protein